MGNLYTIALRR